MADFETHPVGTFDRLKWLESENIRLKRQVEKLTQALDDRSWGSWVGAVDRMSGAYDDSELARFRQDGWT
jgi:hypothetical protein